MGPTAKDTSVSDVKQKCFQCLFAVTEGSLNKETNQGKERWKEILICHYNTLDETCYLLVLLFNIVI